MKLPIRVSVLCAVLALFFVGSAYAQTWNLPDSRRNNRFSTDLYDIVRLALTVSSPSGSTKGGMSATRVIFPRTRNIALALIPLLS